MNFNIPHFCGIGLSPSSEYLPMHTQLIFLADDPLFHTVPGVLSLSPGILFQYPSFFQRPTLQSSISVSTVFLSTLTHFFLSFIPHYTRFQKIICENQGNRHIDLTCFLSFRNQDPIMNTVPRLKNVILCILHSFKKKLF